MFTTTLSKAIRHWTLLTVCSILLTLALVACGGGSTASSTPTPTPKPTVAPSPTAASNTQTYTGDGFTIDYPSSWQMSTPAAGQVVLADPTSGAGVRINVVDNTGGQTADAIVTATLQQFQSQYANLQQASDVPNSAMVGGDTWSQGGATYDVTSNNGQTANFKGVILADAHPANSSMPKGFLLVYAAPTAMFDQVNSDVFQPMLQTFIFTS